ncbi:MAG: hypothetical protein B7Y31_03830 [Novosphingobium sp. 16-62-11]|nr:MAG: hypothetical protein B7Y31_03830 [Novosphingobium sp. 16-62-11]
MSDNTKIEWADATVNAVNGCSVTSPGCTNCYAMKQAHRFDARRGLTTKTNGGMVWTGEVRLNEKQLLQPLSWKRPRRIFWNAHGDLFHESVPNEWIDRVMAVCALTPQHTHMILTKRSARMREYCLSRFGGPGEEFLIDQIEALVEFEFDAGREPGKPLPNVWLGVSVEDQTRADERIPDLLATPAAVRFLSCEPLLGPVDLRWIAEPDEDKDGVIDALLGCNWIDNGRGEEFRPVRPGHQDRVMHRWVCSPEADILANRKLNWVIAGGESGPGARPMHPDWARSLRDQCAAAGVPFHFKQWGEWVSVYDRDRDDPEWNKVPKPGDWDRKRWLNLAGGQGFHGDKLNMMRKVGKKAAGRLLDGVTHDGVPA